MRVNAIQGMDGNTVIDRTNTVNSTENFSSYLQTTASLEEIFTEAAERYHVPKDLIKAIAKTESDFDPNATSGSGAQGLMQLMPATARELGVTDAYDPYQNVMGGTKYISQLLDKYDGDVKLALAAYNAGSGNVAKYGGIPPFKETQNYVVKVMNYMNGGVQVPDDYYPAAGAGNAAAKAAETATGGITGRVSGILAAASVEEAEENYFKGALNQLFSYDDYLRFIELYTKVQTEQKEKEQEEEKMQVNAPDSYYSYREIKYNPAVLGIINSND